jgi:transposase
VKHPGFGAVTAYCVWAEVGEIERFGGAAELISYAGLAPRSEDSDAYQGRRRLPKRCSKRLRYLMVLAAQGAARSRWWTKAKATYRRVKGHHGANTAKIAAARDLLRHVFHTWRGLRAAEEAAA